MSSAKTLRISFVGMQTQDVAIKPNVRVILKSDAEQLDEVVVTAMGIKRDRKALGYAAQDLNSEQLNKAGTTSLASAIQGKLTGVDIRQSSGAPGASSQIVIRGARSFDGNNQPLYVIDGMPVNTTADFDTEKSVTGANYADRSIDINPEDIEYQALPSQHLRFYHEEAGLPELHGNEPSLQNHPQNLPRRYRSHSFPDSYLNNRQVFQEDSYHQVLSFFL